MREGLDPPRPFGETVSNRADPSCGPRRDGACPARLRTRAGSAANGRLNRGGLRTCRSLLGIPSVLIGFALPDDGKHAANERLHLPTLERAIETSIRFLAEDRMIIDAHCHAGKGDGLTGAWDTDASLHRYLRRARNASMAQTVLFPAFHSNYREANRAVAQVIARADGSFLGFAMVHAVRDEGRIETIVAEALGDYGFRGIKVHRHDARIAREICDVARAFGLPILYDVMGETSAVELPLARRPDVTFIIPHLRQLADDWRAHVAVVDELVRYRMAPDLRVCAGSTISSRPSAARLRKGSVWQ